MTAADPLAVRLVDTGAPHGAVLAALHAACFDDPWSEADMAAFLAMPGTRAVIATAGEDGAAVAFAIIRVVADECEVITIGVVPAWRRRGTGRVLLDHCQAIAAEAGADRMILEAAESNRPALALYASLGYTAVGQRAGYYRGRDGRRETAYVLARDLPGPAPSAQS